MRLPISCIIGVVAVVSGSLNAVAHSAPSVSQQAKLKAMFQAKYDARSLAFSQKNVNKYLSFITSDYTFYGPDGDIQCSSKEEDREKLVAYLATHSVKKSHEPVVNVQPTVGGMIVTIQRNRSGITNRDFWVKMNGTWLIKQHRDARS